jgi:hypothetical protein
MSGRNIRNAKSTGTIRSCTSVAVATYNPALNPEASLFQRPIRFAFSAHKLQTVYPCCMNRHNGSNLESPFVPALQ